MRKPLLCYGSQTLPLSLPLSSLPLPFPFYHNTLIPPPIPILSDSSPFLLFYLSPLYSNLFVYHKSQFTLFPHFLDERVNPLYFYLHCPVRTYHRLQIFLMSILYCISVYYKKNLIFILKYQKLLSTKLHDYKVATLA